MTLGFIVWWIDFAIVFAFLCLIGTAVVSVFQYLFRKDVEIMDVKLMKAFVEGILAKLNSAIKWKGNFAPDTRHFPEESIKFDGGILVEEKKVWISHTFLDGDKTRVVKAVGDWDKFGQSGGNDVITLDGEDVENSDLTISPVTGQEGLFNFYARSKVEYKYIQDGKSYDLRFDGPV